MRREIISRRSLLAAPAILLLPRGASAWTHGVVTAPFPGQAGNPVGHTNTPASQPSVWPGGTWPGAWPGTFKNVTNGFSLPVALGTGAGGTFNLTSGSVGAPTIIAFMDFQPSGNTANNINATGGNGGNQTIVHDITFVGCRFTADTAGSNLNSCVQLFRDGPGAGNGSFNITFSYCTFAPLPSLYTQPIPTRVWPSSSFGTGTTWPSGTGGWANTGNTYVIDWNVSYRDAISVSVPPGGFVYLDHCDLWGWGEGIACTTNNFWTTPNIYPPAGQLNVTDCWIHDSRSDSFDLEHQNAIMGCTNANGLSNALFRHNTVSGLGNTNMAGLQHLMTANTFYDPTRNYTAGPATDPFVVGATDGFAYQCILANGPGTTGAKDPAGNTNTTFWTQFQVNSYRNVSFINNHFSGMNNGCDMGIGSAGVRASSLRIISFQITLCIQTKLLQLAELITGQMALIVLQCLPIQ